MDAGDDHELIGSDAVLVGNEPPFFVFERGEERDGDAEKLGGFLEINPGATIVAKDRGSGEGEAVDGWLIECEPGGGGVSWAEGEGGLIDDEEEALGLGFGIGVGGWGEIIGEDRLIIVIEGDDFCGDDFLGEGIAWEEIDAEDGGLVIGELIGESVSEGGVEGGESG